MLGTLIDLELPQQLPAEAILGQHAPHRSLDHLLRLLRKSFSNGLRLQRAGAARVPVINLVVELVAGETHPFGIDDHDEIAGVEERGELWFVLASQEPGDLCGEPAQDLVRRVDYDSLFIFKYSPRPYTPALKLGDEVPEEVKDERLARLFAVVEGYPELKATQAFRDLQVQLEGTENRIAVERRRFNEVTQAYNTVRRRFPAVLFSQPDLLLLDEPTNYLDLEGALWLESDLARYRHTVIVISRDRELRTRAVGAMLHLQDLCSLCCLLFRHPDHRPRTSRME